MSWNEVPIDSTKKVWWGGPTGLGRPTAALQGHIAVAWLMVDAAVAVGWTQRNLISQASCLVMACTLASSVYRAASK